MKDVVNVGLGESDGGGSASSAARAIFVWICASCEARDARTYLRDVALSVVAMVGRKDESRWEGGRLKSSNLFKLACRFDPVRDVALYVVVNSRANAAITDITAYNKPSRSVGVIYFYYLNCISSGDDQSIRSFGLRLQKYKVG